MHHLLYTKDGGIPTQHTIIYNTKRQVSLPFIVFLCFLYIHFPLDDTSSPANCPYLASPISFPSPVLSLSPLPPCFTFHSSPFPILSYPLRSFPSASQNSVYFSSTYLVATSKFFTRPKSSRRHIECTSVSVPQATQIST